MPSCPRCHTDMSPTIAVCPACGTRVAGSARPSATQATPLRQAETKLLAWLPLGSRTNATPDRRATRAQRNGEIRTLSALVAGLLIGALLTFVLGGLLGSTRSTPLAGAPAESGIQSALSTLAPTIATKSDTRPSKEFPPDTVLLADDFDNPSRSRLLAVQNETASYAFSEGSYAITLKQPRFMARSSLGGNYADIAVEADATFDSGPYGSAAGIIFRYQDDDNFYLYRISDAGNYSLAVYTTGQQRMLLDWTDSPAINRRGRPNKLRVEAAGDQIRLFVNGKFLGETSDSSLRAGEIALAVSTFVQGGATFLFDNLVVRSLT